MSDRITENKILKREIVITDDGEYKIKFIIDEEECSLTVIDDYDRAYSHSWDAIGDRTFIDFLLSISKGYLACKLFGESDYILDLKESKKRAKRLIVTHFENGRTKEEKGKVLKEINAFDIEDSQMWYIFISGVDCVDHSRIDWDSYPVCKKLRWQCQKILDTFEKKLKPYLRGEL